MDYQSFETAFNKLGFSIVNGTIQSYSLMNISQCLHMAKKCGFNLNDNQIVDFKQNFYYYENGDEIEFFDDLLDATGFNFEYAEFVWGLAEIGEGYYSVFTQLDCNLHNDEAILMYGKHYQTFAGEYVLEGNQARMFFYDAQALMKVGKKDQVTAIGGFWKRDDGKYAAFNFSNVMQVETFLTQESAIDFATNDIQ